MEPYHLRRSDKALTDPRDHDALLLRAEFVTLALCAEGEPYLVTVNHGYDPVARHLYFHCAPAGKKLDIIRANPKVWGQALEDLGYLQGECDHAYRTVHFSGTASVVQDFEEKRRALALMIDQLERDPGPVKARNLDEAHIRGVCIVRVDLGETTGKEGPTPKGA